MGLFITVFFVMLLLVVVMSIGVLMGRKPISGSCGGMSALGMELSCDICGGDKSLCDEENDKAQASFKKNSVLYYRAGSDKE